MKKKIEKISQRFNFPAKLAADSADSIPAKYWEETLSEKEGK